MAVAKAKNAGLGGDMPSKYRGYTPKMVTMDGMMGWSSGICDKKVVIIDPDFVQKPFSGETAEELRANFHGQSTFSIEPK